MAFNNYSKIYIGTSGWNYKDWKNDFYSGIKQKEWLEYYSQQFNAVEVNATFYRMLKKDTLLGWYNRTPQDFAFAAKGSRYLTHIKRLNDPQEPIERQKENLYPLGNKLKTIIWQFPATLQKNLNRLRGFAQALQIWSEVRHALEFRHASWFDDETANVLSDSNLASCISDAADWTRWNAITTDMVYIRLHGIPTTYISSYSKEELKLWANHIKQWSQQGHTIHIYFDNTDQGEAPKNAQELKKYLHDDT